jgi:hypothetical protein
MSLVSIRPAGPSASRSQAFVAAGGRAYVIAVSAECPSYSSRDAVHESDRGGDLAGDSLFSIHAEPPTRPVGIPGSVVNIRPDLARGTALIASGGIGSFDRPTAGPIRNIGSPIGGVSAQAHSEPRRKTRDE